MKKYKQWHFYNLHWDNGTRYFKGIVIYYDGMFRDILGNDEWDIVFDKKNILSIEEI